MLRHFTRPSSGDRSYIERGLFGPASRKCHENVRLFPWERPTPIEWTKAGSLVGTKMLVLRIWVRVALLAMTFAVIGDGFSGNAQSGQSDVSRQVRDLLPYDGLQGTGGDPSNCQLASSELPWMALDWSSAQDVPVAAFSSYDPKPRPEHYSLLEFLNTRLDDVLGCSSRISSDVRSRYRGKSNPTPDTVRIHGFGASGFLSGGKGGMDIELAFRQIRKQGFCRSTPRNPCKDQIQSHALQYVRFFGGEGTGETWARLMVAAYGEPASFTESDSATSASYDGRNAVGQYYEARRDATWWLPGRTVTLYWGLESGEGRLTVWHEGSLQRRWISRRKLLKIFPTEMTATKAPTSSPWSWEPLRRAARSRGFAPLYMCSRPLWHFREETFQKVIMTARAPHQWWCGGSGVCRS